MGRLILALVLVLSPLLARASTPNWSVEVGGGSHWVTDSSYEIVSSSKATGGYNLAAGWTPGWLEERLSFRLGYGGSGSSSKLFSVWTASLQLASFDAGARYDFARAGQAKAYARGAFLFDIASLDIVSGDSSIAATAYGAGVTAALGGEWSFTDLTSDGGAHFSLLLEAGWSQRFASAQFNASNATRFDSSGPEPIESVPVKIGDIDLSGPFVQAAAVIRF